MDKLEIQKQIDIIKNKSVKSVYDFNKLMQLQKMLSEGENIINDKDRGNQEEDQ